MNNKTLYDLLHDSINYKRKISELKQELKIIKHEILLKRIKRLFHSQEKEKNNETK